VKNSINSTGAKDYFELLSRSIQEYTRTTEYFGEGEDMYPQGIFCQVDLGDKLIFELHPPRPPEERRSGDKDRTVVGSPAGRISAELILKQVERVMRKVDIGWSQLSTNIISQFCYILLKRVIHHDEATGGDPIIYRVVSDKATLLYPRDMFPKARAAGSSYSIRLNP